MMTKTTITMLFYSSGGGGNGGGGGRERGEGGGGWEGRYMTITALTKDHSCNKRSGKPNIIDQQL